MVGYSRHKKKTTFIGGMELVSLSCNRDFTSASSYGLGWYKYAIALSDTSFIPPMHGGFLLISFGVIASSSASENPIACSFGTYRNGIMSDILER